MSQIEKESLSALLDDEADDLELRRILKACEQDPALLATWERYNLAKSLLHETAIVVSPELSHRIANQIQSEPALASGRPPFANWQQNLVKLVIAASVAVVFIVAIQTNLDNEAVPALVQQAESTAPSSVDIDQPVAILAETEVFEVDPIAHQRLVEYIARLTFDEEEPVRLELLQDSPLYRLVNELQTKP